MQAVRALSFPKVAKMLGLNRFQLAVECARFEAQIGPWVKIGQSRVLSEEQVSKLKALLADRKKAGM